MGRTELNTRLFFLVSMAMATEHPALAMPGPSGKNSPPEISAPPDSGALEVPKPRIDSLGGNDPRNDVGNDVGADDGRLLAPRKKLPRRGREPRIWSVGLRAGSQGNTGILSQYVGDGEVAWNVGLNMSDYNGKLGVGIIIDRLKLFDDEFNSITLPTLPKWYASRGKILYLAGLGIQLDTLGLYPRFPIGAQYTMLGDPVTWSAQVTLFIGQVAGTRPAVGFGLAPEIAVRYVIE